MSSLEKIKKLQECIEFAKEELGNGFLAGDIFSAEGLPVVEGYHSNPKASALFANITEYIRKAVRGSNFPDLRDYYLIELEDNKAVIVILDTDFEWGMLVDTKQVKLGYLFSIFLPQAIEKFQKISNM
jgi:hypothetical protein